MKPKKEIWKDNVRYEMTMLLLNKNVDGEIGDLIMDLLEEILKASDE